MMSGGAGPGYIDNRERGAATGCGHLSVKTPCHLEPFRFDNSGLQVALPPFDCPRDCAQCRESSALFCNREMRNRALQPGACAFRGRMATIAVHAAAIDGTPRSSLDMICTVRVILGAMQRNIDTTWKVRRVNDDNSVFGKDLSRREAMKTAMKGAAYAAPVVLAAVVPAAVAAVTPPPGARVTVTPNPSPRAGRVTISGAGFAANGSILLQFVSVSEGTNTAVTPTPVSGTGTFTLAEDLGQEAFNDATLTVNILDASSRAVLATTTVALTGPRV